MLVRITSCTAAVILFASVVVQPAIAATSYEFCVTRVSDTSIEEFGGRYKFGDLDPGKEVARVLVSQKYKRADTKSVSVSDYKEDACGPVREEANITMTGDQLKQLGEAVARGDVVGTAVVATEVVTGVTVRAVEGVGKAGKWVGCRVGIGC